MATAALVSVDTYLQTAYRPDRDYVEGEVLERNVGEIPHSRLQGLFRDLFVRHQAEWQLEALTEVRVQVSQARFRVPDVTVISYEAQDALIVHAAPVLCIEIFSSEDRMSRMQERVADYRAMGVRAVWVLDPWRRVAYTGAQDGRLTPEEGALTVPGTAVSVTVEEIFAELDRLQQRAGS